MKHLLTLSFILVLSLRGLACTCDPAYSARGFCQVISGSHTKPMFCVVQGRVVAYHHYGIFVEVLDNIYNTASQDTILVWGDMGACCRPTFTGFAQILPGDTLVMALEQTDLCGNWIAPQMPDYEDTNDYVLQGCGEYFMRYQNGMVAGVFDSAASQPDTMAYALFVAQVQECITATNIKSATKKNPITVYPNPVNDILYIRSGVKLAKLVVYNSVGQSIYTTEPKSFSAQLDMRHLLPDVYFLELVDSEGVIVRKNVVRR